MKDSIKINLYLLLLIIFAVYFALANLTVEQVAKGAANNFIATLQIWLGLGSSQPPASRQLPQNQGDSEEYIKPIDQLEEIK